jgi:hypothetical protein
MSETMVPPVLGLDTDSRGYHWVSSVPLYFGDDDAQGATFGAVQASDDNPDIRRAVFTKYAAALFAQLPPKTHVFCEEPLALQNGKTTRTLGLAAGSIVGAFVLAAPDAWWHWVDSAHWKKEVLGRGTPPKDFDYSPKSKRVKAWIRQETMKLAGFQLYHAGDRDTFEENWNLYDAFCLKTYGVRESIINKF